MNRMTIAQAHRAAAQADGDRARLLYRGSPDVDFDSPAWKRWEAKVRATPEYQEAQARLDAAMAVTQGAASPNLRSAFRAAGL